MGNQVYNYLDEQAVAQGIAVLAAAGDGGPAGCDARIECIASGRLQGQCFVISIEREDARPARMLAPRVEHFSGFHDLSTSNAAAYQLTECREQLGAVSWQGRWRREGSGSVVAIPSADCLLLKARLHPSRRRGEKERY
ncbi:MAG: hypothetical protein P4K93_03890 [Terracidiphilus sp.]|nr:hypothetical protein [Terracidiphilus sp.]MDR3797266.1 hypothetical protein [Terracidiphilus sp.]